MQLRRKNQNEIEIKTIDMIDPRAFLGNKKHQGKMWMTLEKKISKIDLMCVRIFNCFFLSYFCFPHSTDWHQHWHNHLYKPLFQSQSRFELSNRQNKHQPWIYHPLRREQNIFTTNLLNRNRDWDLFSYKYIILQVEVVYKWFLSQQLTERV